ncbi:MULTISPECIES: hypothetical protein [Moorena]|nr:MULTISPECIES: hypothetical protein [Moorena]NEO13668.1 hypothetical protein [Moorena sp. SIO3E8]NEQ00092.1 hypothetical protein [Moorena sp. SIO3F7]
MKSIVTFFGILNNEIYRNIFRNFQLRSFIVSRQPSAVSRQPSALANG